MIQTLIVTEDSFIQAFADAWRGENFSLAGLRALFAYYETREDPTGKPVELDVIGICTTWTEYASGEVLMEAYPCTVGVDSLMATLDYLAVNHVILEALNSVRKSVSYLVAQAPY